MSKRENYCIRIASLYAIGRRGPVVSLLRDGIEKDHLPPRFFSELFIHCSLLVGFPSMLDGLEKLRRIVPSWQPGPRAAAPSLKKGLSVFRKIYGQQAARVLGNMKTLHPQLPAWILRDTYGRVFARRGLTLRERELLNVVILAIQGLEKQLTSHLRGAIRVGVSRPTLAECLKLAFSIARKDVRRVGRLLQGI